VGSRTVDWGVSFLGVVGPKAPMELGQNTLRLYFLAISNTFYKKDKRKKR
jgi:hypothetical protein